MCGFLPLFGVYPVNQSTSEFAFRFDFFLGFIVLVGLVFLFIYMIDGHLHPADYNTKIFDVLGL